MTNPEEGGEEERELINQLSLLNRLIESQEKGEKITFDLENPDVLKDIQRLQDTIQKKLGKKEGQRFQKES